MLIFVELNSCGEYRESKLNLRPDQISAISNFLTQECIQKNLALFNELTNNTRDWAKSDLTVGQLYKYKISNVEKELVILKMTSSVMYVFVESKDGEEKDKVYKYTTTDNDNHIGKIKTLACNSKNTFGGNSNEFSYTANSSDPDNTDPDRTEYKSTYTILGSRPIFFSLFKRSFSKKVYIDDSLSTSSEVSVSFADGNKKVNISDYETKFNNALHCTFNTIAPAWLDADFPSSLALSLSGGVCTAGVFDWSVDIDP